MAGVDNPPSLDRKRDRVGQAFIRFVSLLLLGLLTVAGLVLLGLLTVVSVVPWWLF